MTQTRVTEQADRFEIEADGVRAGLARFVDHGGRRILFHTEVDDAFEGQGLPGSTELAPTPRPHPGTLAALSHLNGPPARLRHSAWPGHPSGDARNGDARCIQAERLVSEALDATRDAGLRVVPVCSYVARFIGKHEEYADLADPVTHETIRLVEQLTS